mmetsp:Transcript_27616/g.20021  ORF Transcript_27616/g.20021 Transcript_27616/m.20021 type:complete len:223 (-) Transcript_27616:410-1078(-)
MLLRDSRESLTAKLTTVKVAVVLAVPLKEDAVAEAVEKEIADVDAVVKAVEKVADNADPVPLRLMRTETQLMLTEPREVVTNRDTRVRPVRMDTLRIDVKDTSSDVETARVAMEEATGVIDASPLRKKVRMKLLRLRRPRPRRKRMPRKRRKKLPLLRRKLRNQLRSKKRRRKRPESLLMTSLLTENLLASRTRLETLKRLIRRTFRRKMVRRLIRPLLPII